MTMKTLTSKTEMMYRPRQRGVVMVLCLIVLFAMTLIGVSSMDSAVLEIKMSNTMQQQVVALNRAEGTLGAVEDRIDELVTDGTVYDFNAKGDGFYPRDSGENFLVTDWSKLDSEPGPVVTDNGIDDDDAYVVEFQGSKPIPGETIKESINGAISGGAVYSFRNTVRSSSGRSAVRIVQSVYVTLDSP